MTNPTLYIKHIATAGETFDGLALKYYDDETLCHLILKSNPDYIDFIVFEGGERLKIPMIENLESAESLPPWLR